MKEPRMTKMKTLARFAAAAILATGIFAGSSGSAEAARDWHHRYKAPVVTEVDDGTVIGGGGATTQRFDTGWG